MSEQRTDSEILIDTIPKNASEEIRITRSRFKGYDLIAARVYYEDKDSGEKRPTRKGLTVRAEKVPAIIAGLQRALEGGAK